MAQVRSGSLFKKNECTQSAAGLLFSFGLLSHIFRSEFPLNASAESSQTSKLGLSRHTGSYRFPHTDVHTGVPMFIWGSILKPNLCNVLMCRKHVDPLLVSLAAAPPCTLSETKPFQLLSIEAPPIQKSLLRSDWPGASGLWFKKKDLTTR